MASTPLDDVARRHGLRLVLRFGSTVTGRTHPRSDLDLAVLFEHTPDTLAAQADLLADLHDLFPGQDVDLAVINHADPLFLKKITERCELLVGDLRDLQELRIFAFKRYQDHRRYLALERDYVDRAIRSLTR